MKYCHRCGKGIDDGAIFCSGCGAMQDGTLNSSAYGGFSYGGHRAAPYQDRRSFGYALLGFFIPIVGFILWIMWRDTRPETSKSALKGAIIGAVVNFVLSILMSVALYNLGGILDSEGLGAAAYIFQNRL